MISIIIISVISTVRDSKLNTLAQLETNLIDTTYEAIVKEYAVHASILYENVINKNEILSIVNSAKTAPSASRKKLFNKLNPMYENMGNFKLRQLHFHLNNNESFLRFHRPKKYGDNLSDIRATVKYVNEKHLPVNGFEEGRIYNGYRFVFPLSYREKHIGSVETSISMQSIVDSLTNLLNAEVNFMLDTTTVKNKVFKSEQSNYTAYEFLPSHVADKNIHNSKLIDDLLSKRDNIIAKNIHVSNTLKTQSFPVTMNYKGYFASILSIPRALSDKSVAHIIILKEHPELYYMQIQSIAVSSILILLIGLLLYYIYKTEKKKVTIEIKNRELILSEEKFKNLFNLQKNIIVVTDGKKLKMVNEAMCNFFGINYKEFFEKYHDDISDRFIESENYFNKKKVPEGTSWVEAIETLDGDERIVVMHDLHNEVHAFNVSISKFDDVDYIVLLTDITVTVLEKMNLSKKVIKDNLTGAFNREFFDSNIFSIIKHLEPTKRLGLTIVDIDYFKNVNDTYGHSSGDEILKELTELIKSSIREDDYFIRWGGEEFIILTRTVSTQTLLKAIEHIKQRVENNTFTDVKQITCSFGTTLYIGEEDINETVMRADKALYRAKESGRNRVVLL